MHQIRNGRKVGGLCIFVRKSLGGLCIFVHESFCYNIRKDLFTNNYDIEKLSLEVEKKRSKNIILNVTYKQPNGDIKINEN